MKRVFNPTANNKGFVSFQLQQGDDCKTFEVETSELLDPMRHTRPFKVLDYTRTWVLFSVIGFQALTEKQSRGLHTETANGDYWLTLDYFLTYFVPDAIIETVFERLERELKTGISERQTARAEDMTNKDF